MNQNKSDKINVEAKEFRSKTTAAVIASAKIKDVAEHDDTGND